MQFHHLQIALYLLSRRATHNVARQPQIVKKEQAREWIYLSLAMVKCMKIWLFSEYEVHRQNQARKAREVVPFEGVALDEKHRKEREYDQ